jgi:hypothetical protein
MFMYPLVGHGTAVICRSSYWHIHVISVPQILSKEQKKQNDFSCFMQVLNPQL